MKKLILLVLGLSCGNLWAACPELEYNSAPPFYLDPALRVVNNNNTIYFCRSNRAFGKADLNQRFEKNIQEYELLPNIPLQNGMANISLGDIQGTGDLNVGQHILTGGTIPQHNLSNQTFTLETQGVFNFYYRAIRPKGESIDYWTELRDSHIGLRRRNKECGEQIPKTISELRSNADDIFTMNDNLGGWKAGTGSIIVTRDIELISPEGLKYPAKVDLIHMNTSTNGQFFTPTKDEKSRDAPNLFCWVQVKARLTFTDQSIRHSGVFNVNIGVQTN
ncbi:hypothetical protein [Actinobacillus genomosp. 1]|uniref:hypothetical protein n=1 Tax=Actinobacillus genomosp. 1 TaxID=254839 RepID=UPI00244212FC|nr:hypothetical protein [Actinobacillus genomosp. 1]WGE90471.1 hypothetical protein NYR63_06380 [Actinobacillus genomosp. 1]